MTTDLIYVSDDFRHLVCFPYSIGNLHRMAEDLGIGRHFFHKGRHPHYDIPKRRIAEILSNPKTFYASPRVIVRITQGGLGDRLWPEGWLYKADGQITLRRPLRIHHLPPPVPTRRRIIIDLGAGVSSGDFSSPVFSTGLSGSKL